MQCSSCQFHNMPGSDVCGRCGSSLNLATAVIDVHPPRAGALQKKFRRIARPAQGVMRPARQSAGATAAAWISNTRQAMLPMPLVWRLVIPGWSHFYLGQKARGWFMLGSYFTSLIPGLILIGSTWGTLWLISAFVAHSSAVLDIVMQAFSDRGPRDRLGRSFLVSAAIGIFIYFPLGWLLFRVAEPHPIAIPNGPFQPGDVILVNHEAYRWHSPVPGDVVLYEIPGFRVDLRAFTHAMYVYEGDRLDRVLAGPLDHVKWADGELFVNGNASPHKPLWPGAMPPLLEFMVPEDHYLIFPTTTPYIRNIQLSRDWSVLSLVARDRIRGRAWLRNAPLSRMRWITSL